MVECELSWEEQLSFVLAHPAGDIIVELIFKSTRALHLNYYNV